MNMMIRSSITIMALVFAGSAAAEVAQVGSNLTAITLADQFDKTCAVNTQTKVVIFSSDKAVDTMVSEYLSQQGGQKMQQNGMVYLADINKMPALVTKMFAMPKMRKLTFPICLSKQANALNHIPRQAGKASVVKLDGLAVKSIGYASNKAQLEQLSK